MILIISEVHDIQTDYVCAWLNQLNVKYLRINTEDRDFSIEITLDNSQVIVSIVVNSAKYPLNCFSTAWFRRGRFPIPEIKCKVADVFRYL